MRVETGVLSLNWKKSVAALSAARQTIRLSKTL
jgi:hypothetical protein